MFSFSNIPTVTKNLLILNILFFIASLVMMQNQIDALHMLGGHYMNSPLFQPYQVITHFFMHSPTDFFHILFNMLMLVMFGSHLERLWGPKRFFIFYISSALGAFALYNGIGMYQIMELKQKLAALGFDVAMLDEHALRKDGTILVFEQRSLNALTELYQLKISTPMVGASGAIFGIMAAFAYLFPNTELMLLFPPIPVKAKYLMGIYFALEVYLSFRSSVNDNVAHLAHVGGAVVGFALVYFWNRNRNRFY